MDTVSEKQFIDQLESYVEQMITSHEPLKVTRKEGEDLIIMSADDWEREQEALYVLQNSSLMQKIAESFGTHSNDKCDITQPVSGRDLFLRKIREFEM